MASFKIHPAMGVARLGNSEEAFYLSPEQPGALPIACDTDGNPVIENGVEQRITSFKDSSKKIKRQAARFRIFVYENEQDETARELKVGDIMDFELETSVTGRQTVKGTVKDVQWTVHLANKKASWYRFQETAGIHGYASSHPLRNPSVSQPDERRNLIIDPGPLTVSFGKAKKDRQKEFKKGGNPGYMQSFPPHDLSPFPIDTLGALKVTCSEDNHNRLVVLGGFGKSGSSETPVIKQYANNDGWFDDVSDGPVTAKIVFGYKDELGKKKESSVKVDVPAWVIVGYPRYVPEMVDMITMDETIYDVSIRSFGYNHNLYGVAPFDKESNAPKNDTEIALWKSKATWNTDYYPKFFEEIWPILERPFNYGFVYVFDWFGGSGPHNTGTTGNLSKAALSEPPTVDGDPNFRHRQFIYDILRKKGKENQFMADTESMQAPGYHPRAMPDLCGNNPLSNTAAEKFLRLTDTQLFLLKQWADGKFVNECNEWEEGDPNCENPFAAPPTTGIGIDRGALSNVLGGAFCPGAELSWIVYNPAIYESSYRIKHAIYEASALSLPKVAATDGSPAANLAEGLEPGDLTKYLALPWQSDFNQCTEQNLDITYDNWVNLDLESTGDPTKELTAYTVPWWPAHRPLVVYETVNGPQVYWASGIPENNAGSLKMVSAWSDLGFIKKEPGGSYVQTERNDGALGPPIKPGNLRLGNTKQSERNG